MSILMLTDDQQKERRTGIGGSDIAAVLGCDPYRSPWNVWCEKTGRAPPQEENAFTRWGTRLEHAIADDYQERHPEVAVRPSPTLRHPQRIWHIATPDRLCFEMLEEAKWCDRPSYGLEIKNKGFFQRNNWGESGDDADTAVPDEVLAQCHWSMALTELPQWDVCALIGGNDCRDFTVVRDPEAEGVLIEVAERFWVDCVLRDRPPEYDGSDAAWSYLGGKLKKKAKPVPAPAAAHDLARQIIAAKGLIDAASEGKAVAEQKLTAMLIAAGESGYIADEWRFTVSEVSGKVKWKDVAEQLADRLALSPEARAAIEESSRGNGFLGTWFTHRKKRETGNVK
jgi:putative phage-type endonuclease